MRDAEQIYLQRLRAHQQQGRRHRLSRWLDLHDALLRSERAYAEAINSGGDPSGVSWPDNWRGDEFDGPALEGPVLEGPALEAAEAAIAARRARAEAAALPAERASGSAGEDAHRWLLFAEVLAAVESPPEDRAARLELQVSRLASSMGRRADTETNMVDVLREWVASAVGAPASARERMQRALEAYLG